MDDHISNDNDISPAGGTGPGPDAHGQAAMLLVESLIHSLIARSVISVVDAVEIVETAVEINLEIAEFTVPPEAGRKSLAMLEAISTSLQKDLPEE